jgi:hypothetical protein
MQVHWLRPRAACAVLFLIACATPPKQTGTVSAACADPPRTLHLNGDLQGREPLNVGVR